MSDIPGGFGLYPGGYAVLAAVVMAVVLAALAVFASRRSSNAPVILISFLMTVTFVAVVVFSTLRELPESKTGELLLGALISTFTTVVVYWFGKGRSEPPSLPPSKRPDANPAGGRLNDNTALGVARPADDREPPDGETKDRR